MGFEWLQSTVEWFANWIPSWIQVDRNEVAVKHRGWEERTAEALQPGVRWYWPAFSQIEGPFKTVPTVLSTSLVRVDGKVAQGFIKWKITNVIKFAVENDGTEEMLDDLVCAAIREVLDEADDYTWPAIDKKLLDESRKAVRELGVKILAVRLTTLTDAKMHCFFSEGPPVIEADVEE